MRRLGRLAAGMTDGSETGEDAGRRGGMRSREGKDGREEAGRAGGVVGPFEASTATRRKEERVHQTAGGREEAGGVRKGAGEKGAGWVKAKAALAGPRRAHPGDDHGKRRDKGGGRATGERGDRRSGDRTGARGGAKGGPQHVCVGMQARQADGGTSGGARGGPRGKRTGGSGGPHWEGWRERAMVLAACWAAKALKRKRGRKPAPERHGERATHRETGREHTVLADTHSEDVAYRGTLERSGETQQQGITGSASRRDPGNGAAVLLQVLMIAAMKVAPLGHGEGGGNWEGMGKGGRRRTGFMGILDEVHPSRQAARARERQRRGVRARDVYRREARATKREGRVRAQREEATARRRRGEAGWQGGPKGGRRAARLRRDAVRRREEKRRSWRRAKSAAESAEWQRRGAEAVPGLVWLAGVVHEGLRAGDMVARCVREVWREICKGGMRRLGGRDAVAAVAGAAIVEGRVGTALVVGAVLGASLGWERMVWKKESVREYETGGGAPGWGRMHGDPREGTEGRWKGAIGVVLRQLGYGGGAALWAGAVGVEKVAAAAMRGLRLWGRGERGDGEEVTKGGRGLQAARVRGGERRRGVATGGGGGRGQGVAWAMGGWLIMAMMIVGAAGVGDTVAAAVAAPIVGVVADAGAIEVARRKRVLEGGGADTVGSEGGSAGRQEEREGEGTEGSEDVGQKIGTIATLNVDGRMRLTGRDEESRWGNGAEVEAEATREWRCVESYMEGKALVVLTDVCMNGSQLKAAMARLEGSASGAWRCCGTQGRFCPADKRVRGGVLLAWDENVYTAVGREQVVVPGRMIEVTLQDRAGDVFTVLGAYMPTRCSADCVVNDGWEALREVVANRPGYMVIGDLNAELPEALERGGRVRAPYPTQADRWLQTVVEENELISAGPAQATYERGGVASQIDWILADPEVAPRLGAGRVEPGISAHDHRALAVEYRPEGNTIEGVQRPQKPKLDKVDGEAWKDIGRRAGDEVMRALGEAEREKGAGPFGPVERHRARQETLLRMVREKIQEAEACSEEGRKGAGGKSKYERLRHQAAKWEGLRSKMEAEPETHVWFSGEQRLRGRRIWKVRELKQAALEEGVTCGGRRTRMLKIATYEAAKAREAFYEAEVGGGEGLVEALKAAVSEGGEGGITAELFAIINKALRREAKAKTKGGRAQATRARPQVLLSALYEDDDKEKGVVVSTARKVLGEVRRISERTNRAGRSFPGIARGMMARLAPFPAKAAPDRGWVASHVSFVEFEEALKMTSAKVGVGVDGFPAYILRKMPEKVRREYYDGLIEMMEQGEYPEEWSSWIALLAMKPGEDARELGRRRDLWLAPHAVKLLTRCLTKEFDRAVYRAAPASNTGFTPGAGATAQTLTLKLHRARCRRERQDYVVGFCDMGCYFMSICREVQAHAQEWAGVKPEVTDVMAALQKGIKGRSETAYGLTEEYGVHRGIMQGCIGSPARSLLQLRFMQALVRDACRGYKFRTQQQGGGGVPMVFYCDDGAFLCESIAGAQMALDACWVAARVAGLDLRTKAKDATTRRGTKTAWMGCYFDGEGVEHEITGWDMYLPTGERIPQVSQYTHLGVSIQAKWEGRHEEARRNVMRKCMQMIGLIARVESLGPQQVTQAMNLAVGGIIGYTGRSTPIGWEECNRIEQARVTALKRAGLAGGRRRAMLYLPEEAGGLGHIHSYQVAAAALMDEFERAVNAGPGEPAKEAVEGAMEEARLRLGVEGDLYEWMPEAEAAEALDADDEVEAWLQCKARARVAKRASEGRRRERAGRDAAGRGGKEKGEKKGGAREQGGGDEEGEGDERQDRDSLMRGPEERSGRVQEEMRRKWEVGRARKTAKCLGGWEYEIYEAGEGGCSRETTGEWVSSTRVAERVTTARLREARERRQVPESLRARLEGRDEGDARGGSVGRWQVALTGDPARQETVRAVERLAEEWWEHARELGGGEGWNVEDRPRSERPGTKGGWEEHGSKASRSYYRGGRETVTEKGADGKEKRVERSRMGLDADKAWERELPLELTVSMDQVQWTVERVEAGEDAEKVHFPEHAPHTRVQHEVVLHYTQQGQGRVWAGDRDQREEAAREAAERRVRALPDEADEGEVGEAIKEAWRGAVEKYIREHTAGWTDTEKATAMRMAVRESDEAMPGGDQGEASKGGSGLRPGPFKGGGLNGHAMIQDEVLRADPLTRTMLRWDEWEGGVCALVGGEQEGRKVQCGEKTRATMKTGAAGYQTWWALVGTLMPLHYYHHFTRCGFTDGSLDDPRREGRTGVRRVAYGIWEGVQREGDISEPAAGWGSYTGTERMQRCVGAGMWGGGARRTGR